MADGTTLGTAAHAALLERRGVPAARRTGGNRRAGDPVARWRGRSVATAVHAAVGVAARRAARFCRVAMSIDQLQVPRSARDDMNRREFVVTCALAGCGLM